MNVISDTSPILNLAIVDQLELLHQIFGIIIIPDAVALELSDFYKEQAIIHDIQKPSWIEKRPINNRAFVDSLSLELDLGEAEAIVLAIETKADLLLIDERRARKIASRFCIKYIGLLGFLVEAKRRGMVTNIKPIVDNLIIKAGFWISNHLYSQILHEVGE